MKVEEQKAERGEIGPQTMTRAEKRERLGCCMGVRNPQVTRTKIILCYTKLTIIFILQQH